MYTSGAKQNMQVDKGYQMHDFGHTHRALVVGAALAVALAGTALSPITAQAVTEETEAQLSDTQRELENAGAAYSEAKSEADELQAKIAATMAKIAELEQQLPAQQEKASAAMRDMYKSKQGFNPFMSFFFKSENLDDLITKLVYADQIQDSNLKAVEKLSATQQKLEQEKLALEQAKAQADSKQKEARQALEQAQRLREEAQAKAEAELQAELAALAQENAAGAGDVAAPDNSTVDWGVDESAFVAEWAPRIDAYLAGSPLAGQGGTFASAAWRYGVDPRWSPAISNTESSKGRHCFRQHNAWGWGSMDFGSWEEAIDTHVRGLARGYGYTISVEAAKKYCPPNWLHWYNTTLSEMGRI